MQWRVESSKWSINDANIATQSGKWMYCTHNGDATNNNKNEPKTNFWQPNWTVCLENWWRKQCEREREKKLIRYLIKNWGVDNRIKKERAESSVSDLSKQTRMSRKKSYWIDEFCPCLLRNTHEHVQATLTKTMINGKINTEMRNRNNREKNSEI